MLARRTLLRAGGWAAGLALAGWPAAAPAAPVLEIRMRGNADGSKVWFDPVGVLVEPGQTLRWINEDPGNAHTSTAYHPDNADHPLRIPQGAAPWNSDYLLPKQSFELRLTVPGVYDYYCVPHEMAGMVGRIVVGRAQGTPARTPSPASLPEPARGRLPSVEEIVRRKRIRAAP